MKLFKLIGSIGIIGTVTTLVIGVGWVINLVKLTQCDFKSPYKAEVIRIVGLPIVPVGGIVGYLNVGK